MGFAINSKLSFIDSFQFQSASLNSLVKNLKKDDFKCLIQESNKNVLDLVRQEIFYPYEYMTYFEKFKEKLSSKEKFYSLLTDIKSSEKEYKSVLNVCHKFEMKMMKDYHYLYLKCNSFLLEKCDYY